MRPLRHLYQASLPSALRQKIRKVLTELRVRSGDLGADWRDKWGSRATPPLPPTRLRARVGINSSREHFLEIGRRAADDVYGAVRSVAGAGTERWLDFGCGSGRVARHLIDRVPELSGADIDGDAIRWASHHLRGRFDLISGDPPLPYADRSFDVVYSVSVFTHFDERQQFEWLAELHRVLAPEGLMVATTHGPHLTYNRPDLTTENHLDLQRRGFTFRRGTGAFNEDSAFHSRAYMEREWAPWFDLAAFRPSGLADYLDLSVWRSPFRS